MPAVCHIALCSQPSDTRSMSLCHKSRLVVDCASQVMDRLRAVTSRLEQISIDEAFLDVSALPEPAIEVLRQVLRGETVGALDTRFSIERSLPHGHVLSALGTLRSLGVEKMLGLACKERDIRRRGPSRSPR